MSAAVGLPPRFLVPAAILTGLGGCLLGCVKKEIADTSKIECRSVEGGRPVRIYLWKFNRIQDLILESMPSDDSPIDLRDLAQQIESQVPAAEARRIGNIPWFVRQVAAELEVRSVLEREENDEGDYLLRLAKPAAQD